MITYCDYKHKDFVWWPLTQENLTFSAQTHNPSSGVFLLKLNSGELIVPNSHMLFALSHKLDIFCTNS